MRHLMLITLAVGLLALTLTGCVQMHSDTVIAADGSGTADLNLSVSAAMYEAAQDMKAMGLDKQQDMEMPDFDMIEQKEIEKHGKKYGVKVLKFEKSTVEGRPTLALKLAFEDLRGLSYVMAKVAGGDPQDGLGLFAAADGNFVLKKATYEFPDEPEEDEAAEEVEDEAPDIDPQVLQQKQMEIMGKMMGAMAELDISMKFTVPGEIIESNAPTVEGKTSIWTVNSENMMTAGSDMEPVITFSGKGLKIKPLEE